MKRKAQKGMVHMDKGAESKGKEALKGRVHIYWGDGKGKTTAALGLALRAAGRGKQVVIARFLKTEDSGEVFLLRQVPGIRLLPCAKSFGFTFQMDEKIRQEAALFYGGLFSQAVREAKGADLLILDEILPACQGSFVGKEKLEDFLAFRDPALEVVLTGRKPWEELILMADYITQMNMIRHPYQQGILAREGIEY